jgi:hypothetical protein
MPPNGIKLSVLHRWTLYAVFAVLFVTGLAWFVLEDVLAGFGYDDGLAAHPIAPLLLSIHGAAAMLALLVLGSLVPQHIKWAWSGRMNRLTGAVLVGTQALFVLSGYALYYAGNENLRAYASDLHLVFGLGFPLILAGHIVEGRRRRVRASPVHVLQQGLYASFDARADAPHRSSTPSAMP